MDDRVGTSWMCPGNLFCGLDIFPLDYFSKFTDESYQLFVVVLLFLIGIFHEKINGSNINVPYFLQYIFLGSLVVKVILLSWTCGIVLLVTRVKERFLLIYYVISVVVWIPVRSINWILSVRGKPISMRRVFSFSVDLFNSIMCSHFCHK